MDWLTLGACQPEIGTGAKEGLFDIFSLRSRKSEAEREMGKRKWGQCVLCGATTVVTRDHVVPKGLFVPPRPNLLTVPACARCNNGLKLDEEYFRACVLVGKSYDHPEGRALWNTRVRASFAARPGFRALLASQARRGTLQSESGWVLNDVPIFEIDSSRIERVVRKIIRGLYYHHRSEVLGDVPLLITAETLDPSEELRKTADTWKMLPVHRLGLGTLTYRFGVAEDRPTASIWWLLFFNGVLFTVITGVDESNMDVLGG